MARLGLWADWDYVLDTDSMVGTDVDGGETFGGLRYILLYFRNLRLGFETNELLAL